MKIHPRWGRALLWGLDGLLVALLFTALILRTSSVTDWIEGKIRERLLTVGSKTKVAVRSVSLLGTIQLDKVGVIQDEALKVLLKDCALSGALTAALFSGGTLELACESGRLELDPRALLERGLGKAGDPASPRSSSGRAYHLRVERLEASVAGCPVTAAVEATASADELAGSLRGAWGGIAARLDRGVAGSARVDLKQVQITPFAACLPGALAAAIDGEVSGAIRLSRNGPELEASLQDLRVSGARVNHPWVYDEPFGLPPIQISGSARIARDRIEVARLTFQTGGLAAGVEGVLRGRKFELYASGDRLPFNRLAAMLGGEELEGFDLDGGLELMVRLSGDLSAAPVLSMVQIQGKLTDRKQRSDRLDYLKGPFVYLSEDTRGEVRQVAVAKPGGRFVALDTLPRHVYGAVIFSEDAGFFRHPGIELEEIQAAIQEYLLRGRKSPRGGSTVTQQLAKNLFLTRDRNLVRKLKETLLAFELEASLPKKRLLEIYLNGIEWGPGIFGIADAAQVYFGKGASALTPREAVYLASIIPNPRRYYYFYAKDEIPPEWYRQMDLVLERLKTFEYITEDQLEEGLSQKVAFVHERRDNRL